MEDLYASEQALLATQRVIPLFHLPVSYASAPTLKNWSAATGRKLDSGRRVDRVAGNHSRQSMTFRRKLLAVFALTVFLSVAAVALLVLAVTRNAFEKTEDQRTAALVTQFQREFSRRGEDVARRVQAIATSDPVTRMATALNGTSADSAEYFDLARSHGGESPTRLSGTSRRARDHHFFGAVAGEVRLSRHRVRESVGIERAERISETRRIAGLHWRWDCLPCGRPASASILFTWLADGGSTRIFFPRSTCLRTCAFCCIRIAAIIFPRICCWIRLARGMARGVAGPPTIRSLIEAVQQYNQEMTGIVSLVVRSGG